MLEWVVEREGDRLVNSSFVPLHSYFLEIVVGLLLSTECFLNILSLSLLTDVICVSLGLRLNELYL